MDDIKINETVIHHGRNVRKIRLARGFTQKYMAMTMKVSQPTISCWEDLPVIDDKTLIPLAKTLKVDPELIKTMTEDPVVMQIENNTYTFHDSSSNNTASRNGEGQGYHIYYSAEEATRKLNEKLEESLKIIETLKAELENIKKSN